MHAPRIQLGYALRKLLREKVLSAAVVLVLALGIGANLLMFLVYDHLVARPLPYPGLDRIVTVWETNPGQGIQQGAVSIPNFDDWRQRAASFERLAALQRAPLGLSWNASETEIVNAARTTRDFFELTGARLALGQPFPPEKDSEAGATAILSHSLWKRSFGGDPAVLGRAVRADGRAATVVGVLAAGEEFPRGVELWLSTRWSPEASPRGSRSLLVLGRLLPGISLAKANDEMASLMTRLGEEFPEVNAQAGARVQALRESLVANLRPTVSLVFAALGLSLLVVCINVGNLMQVRTSSRRKEFGMRVVLGATRLDLLGQIALEIFFLTLAGCLGALAVAALGRRLLAGSAVGGLLRAESMSFDHRLWLFAGAVAIGVTFCLAVAPALQLLGLRFKTPGAGGEQLGGGGQDSRSAGLLRTFTVVQIAISLPLVVGSFLLLANLRQIDHFEMGFRRDQVHSWRLSFPRGGADAAGRVQLVAEGLARLAAVPGIDHSGVVSSLPFSGSRAAGTFLLADGPRPAGEEEPHSDFRVVGGRYFEAMGIPLQRGRFFTDADGPFGPGVAIVNAALAERYWPGADPVGRRIRVGTPEEQALFGSSIEREVVGVVGNVLHEGLSDARAAELYVPYGQNPSASVHLVIHVVPRDTAATAALAPKAFLGGRSDALISAHQPMRQLVSRSLGYPELQSAVVATLGLISIFLVGLTLYAIISYFVAAKHQSLAIRVAVGAQSSDIVGLVAAHCAWLTGLGLAAGAVCSWTLTTVLAHHVQMIEPRFLLSLALGSVLIAALAALATLAPIRQALKIQPADLLRKV